MEASKPFVDWDENQVYTWARGIVKEDHAAKLLSEEVSGKALLEFTIEDFKVIKIPAGPAKTLINEAKTSTKAELGHKAHTLLLSADLHEKLMKEQEALSIKSLVSPLVEKHGYTFHSILYITEDSAVIRAQNSEGDLALKFLAHTDRGCHEAEILLELQGDPHIIKLIDYFQANCGKYGYVLVFKLYESGMHFKPTSPTELRNFMFQLFQAIDFCHKRGIIHSDIKPSNIFFERNDGISVVLADFGFACKDSEELVGGTTAFVAPEVRTTFRLTPKADIWSAGISFAILLGTINYTDKAMSKRDFLNVVIQRTDDLHAIHLLSQLLDIDSEKRPTAEELLNHPYFSAIKSQVVSVCQPERHPSPTKRKHLLLQYGRS